MSGFYKNYTAGIYLRRQLERMQATKGTRPGGRYKTCTFTDLEKKANGHPTGRWTRTFTVPHFPPGELEALIETMRKEQKEKNDAFRRRQFGRGAVTGDSDKVKGEEKTDEEKAASSSVSTPRAEEPRKGCPTCGSKEFHVPLGSASPPKLLEVDAPNAGLTTSPPAASSRIDLRLDVGTGNSTALLGSSKQGKSTCMMYLYRQHYSQSGTISTLFASNPQLSMYGDKRLIICQAYEPKLIKLAAAINRKTRNYYDFCFLLDDIVDKRDDVVLKELILTLRNSNLSSIVCLQYSNLLAKVARANVNNLLLFGFNSDEAIELVCQQFLAGHLRERKVPRDDWSRYYREATKNHGFIYVHPNSGEISYHRLAPPRC